MSAISLTIYLGIEKPEPVPRELVEALESAEVTLVDKGRSGFKMVFQVGRSGLQDAKDYKLIDIINNPNYFAPFNRVVLVVTLNGNAQTLINGVMNQQEFTPSAELGRSTFSIMGEDISGFMEQSQQPLEHIKQDEKTIVEKILNSARYSKYQIKVSLGDKLEKFSPAQRALRTDGFVPSQQTSDWEYINQLAERFGYVFYITPGPRLLENTAYWGPPTREKIVQPIITVNMGGLTNASAIKFNFNPRSATKVDGYVQDQRTNEIGSVKSIDSNRKPLAAASVGSLVTNKSQKAPSPDLRQVSSFRETARETVIAQFYAQSQVNQSNDNVLTVSGELDTVRYGAFLQLRGLVNLRGVGYTYDGTYYIKSITHNIRKGDYKQSFTLTREGLGSTRK